LGWITKERESWKKKQTLPIFLRSLRSFAAKKEVMSNDPRPGSSGNVIAALCSLCVAGLGQLVQGRVLKALFMFVLAGLLWWVLLGWVVHIWSAIDAARYRE
jgi:hypothetical protein